MSCWGHYTFICRSIRELRKQTAANSVIKIIGSLENYLQGRLNILSMFNMGRGEETEEITSFPSHIKYTSAETHEVFL